jgi:hypothetical protein
MANNDWDDLKRWSREQRDKKPDTSGPSVEGPILPVEQPINQHESKEGEHDSLQGSENLKPEIQKKVEDYSRIASDPRGAVGDQARKAIADKTGIKLPKGITNDLRTPGKRGKAVRAGADAAISAGLVYMGVPPQISQRIAPKVLGAISVLLSFTLLMVLGVVGGIATSSKNDGIEIIPAYLDVDDRLRNTTKRYSEMYRIPNRVLLGIAGIQTSYGRYSPYDNIDRDPTRSGPGLADKTAAAEEGVSTYPLSRPAIGSKSDSDQGLGMFLVRPGAAARAKVNPQDVERTIRWLALLMREEADELKKSGIQEPSPNSTDFSASDDFWGKVVASLPLVDPLAGTLRCSAPADTSDVSVIISTIWNCEVDRMSNIGIPIVSGDEQMFVTYNTRRTISGILIRDALTVAWMHGKQVSPNATTWAEISQLPCNDKATIAGVFPIDKTTAKSLGVKDRCDVSELSSAVARAVLNKLNVPDMPPSVPNINPYGIEQDAWSIVPFALGDNNSRLRFAEEGPARPFYPSEVCEKLIVGHITSISLNPNLRNFFVQLAETPGADPISLQSYKEASILLTGPSTGNPRDDRRCLGRSTKIADGPWMETISSEAERLYILLSEGTRISGTGEIPAEVTALHGMSVLAEQILKDYPDALRLAIPGKDPAVERLSSDQIFFEVPPAGITTSTVSFGLWQRALSEALRLGGILPGDPRAGSSFQFSAGGGIGIALQREEPGPKPVIPTQDGTVALPPCGDTRNSVEHRTVPQYVERWMALCTAAASSGVEIGITSSWRSMAEQQYLYDLYGSGRAAAPGNSAHQKGWALDISMNSGQSFSQNATYSYLHSIVGCLNERDKQYKQLGKSLTPEMYIDVQRKGEEPCGPGTIPIKRVQTFGLVPLCTFRLGEDFSTPEVLLCPMDSIIRGTGGQIREPWHLDYGIVVVQLGTQPANCNSMTPIDPTNQQSVAIAVKTIFYCELAAKGLTSVAPIDGPRYPASKYFKNLAEQVSSEAVLVAYCESGLTPNSGDGSSYVGVFQMGRNEMETFGGNAAARTDARLNITAAARYFLYGWERYGNTGWGGWGPWAVVNTDFWETNRAVLRPAIGRFASTHPSAEGEFGPDLPAWAIDPTGSWGISGGCGEYAYAGKSWPALKK